MPDDVPADTYSFHVERPIPVSLGRVESTFNLGPDTSRVLADAIVDARDRSKDRSFGAGLVSFILILGYFAIVGSLVWCAVSLNKLASPPVERSAPVEITAHHHVRPVPEPVSDSPAVP